MLSGRIGYDFKPPDPSITLSADMFPSRSELRTEVIAMLKYENELRMSEKWIAKMENECNTIDSPLNGYSYAIQSPVIIELQTEVVKRFGYKSKFEIKFGLDRLRSALSSYNNDKEILNAANYLKFNRMRKGDFDVGDSVADYDITLIKLDQDSKNEDVKNDKSDKNDKNDKNNSGADEKKDEIKKDEDKDKEKHKDKDVNVNDTVQVKFVDLLSKKGLNVVIGVSVT